MQAICDADRRFLDVVISHPGTASDLLVYNMSDIRHQLDTVGILCDGLSLFGVNAYVNNQTMTTPFKNVREGTDEDNYNFFQSQLRINIECAFGMLTQRWGVLRRPINAHFGIKKIGRTVIALCKLHNFLIDRRCGKLMPILIRDSTMIELVGGLPRSHESSVSDSTDPEAPSELVGRGEHFDDVGVYERRRLLVLENTPRFDLMNAVIEKDMKRPSKRK